MDEETNEAYDQAVEEGDYSDALLDKSVIGTERIVAAVERLRNALLIVGDELRESRWDARHWRERDADTQWVRQRFRGWPRPPWANRFVRVPRSLDEEPTRRILRELWRRAKRRLKG